MQDAGCRCHSPLRGSYGKPGVLIGHVAFARRPGRDRVQGLEGVYHTTEVVALGLDIDLHFVWPAEKSSAEVCQESDPARVPRSPLPWSDLRRGEHKTPHAARSLMLSAGCLDYWSRR